MSWNFSDGRPIYSQLVEQIQLRIVTGVYPPGTRMDSVRDLAGEASVNPNTMQRALAELEKQGLVFSQRTSGRFVTDDPGSIASLRSSLACEKIEHFLAEMDELGYKRPDVIGLLKKEELQ